MKEFPVNGILRFLEREKDCLFLDTAKPDAENYLSYLFLRPKKIISTFKVEQVEECLRALDQALKAGYYVAGFMAYEAGQAFEERLTSNNTFQSPLLWFGVYDQPLVYNHRQRRFRADTQLARRLIKKISGAACAGHQPFILKKIKPNISLGSYLRAIDKIKQLIASGFTYQVNYTFKLKFSFSGNSSDLFLKLRNNQHVAYSALLRLKKFDILSFSPELFFRREGQRLMVRPMKGTAERGKDTREDAEMARSLRSCLKNRSENLMIVDLLRNDLGRISRTASINVPQLFNIERYRTLFQMTSDIRSRLRSSYSACDIFRHIFPSGSVTGAPKIKTMQIIQQLEKEPRNVYTGSIGFFSPRKKGIFNVAIRTVLINKRNQKGEMGVGSGIVYDSDPKKEYAECCLKANFLTKDLSESSLIETMLWQPDQGYFLLDRHLSRLENSARYFDFLYKKQELLAALEKLTQRFSGRPQRVRLLLNKLGQLSFEFSQLPEQPISNPKIYLSSKKTDSANPFLYHKTTQRALYDQEYKTASAAGFYDVIFTNQKDQLTEGAISNIFLKKNGIFYTPPLVCGVLDGVYRRYLLDSKKYPIKEKALFKRDLFQAGQIYLANSVRGLVKVSL
ncbi:aminodeoxychorismate synthase component I [Candidatus Omnitrophota bacterium]